MSSSRSTTIDRVGVCTRPTVVRKKPPLLLLKAVIALVPLIPTNQSASERQRAASAKGCISLSERKLAKPSRIAAGVIDCNQSLLMVCDALACWAMSLKINSPSRPASQALMSVVTSLRLISFCSTFKRDSVLAMGRKSK